MKHKKSNSGKLRPWNAEDVPFSCIIKKKTWSRGWSLALGVGIDGIDISGNTAECGDAPNIALVSFQQLFVDYKHSANGGMTWLPCGVLE